MAHRGSLERFLKSKYLDEKAGSTSRVMTKSRGAEIVEFLEGKDEKLCDAHFKLWVKSHGFRVMDYPALGLKDVLCLPVKKRVSCCQ